jgi:hypothetical protein
MIVIIAGTRAVTERLFDGIKQYAPDVTSILSSAAKIVELIKG